jgi:hypothetical protein
MSTAGAMSTYTTRARERATAHNDPPPTGLTRPDVFLANDSNCICNTLLGWALC